MTDEHQQDSPQDETPEEPQVEESPEAGAAADETGAEPEGTGPQADEQSGPQADEPTEEAAAEPDAGDGPPDEPQADAPTEADAPADADAPAQAEAPAEAGGEPPAEAAAEEAKPSAPKREGKKSKKDEAEIIPGEHLEPDLVLEEERQRQEQAAGPGQIAAEQAASETGVEGAPVDASEQPSGEEEAQPAARELRDLAADARYRATGKRKSAIARVVLKPGSGSYRINGRELDEFFPRPTLRKLVRQPLEAAGYTERVDVVAKIHGGGVSSQAGALRHGVARALVEADPNLRGDLKREGFLSRDPRVKERKKAGLKKARKRPQFSKR